MIGRLGYLSPFGALPSVGEKSFLGGLRTERKVKPIKRSKDKIKMQLQAKRNNKRVIARLKRRKQKMIKASRLKNRR